MRPTWVGKQYHGEAPCWDFVVDFFATEKGLTLVLDKDGVIHARKDPASEFVHVELSNWQQVPEPEPGDGVLIFYPHVGWHLGIVEDLAHFLHVPTAATGVVRSPLSDHQSYIKGFYRRVGS